MFDKSSPPPSLLNQEVPPDWPVRLVSAEPPALAEHYSSRRREVYVALADGSWKEAVAWAWTWNEAGRPVQWRCQLEIEGRVSWYAYDYRSIEPAGGGRLAERFGRPGFGGSGRLAMLS